LFFAYSFLRIFGFAPIFFITSTNHQRSFASDFRQQEHKLSKKQKHIEAYKKEPLLNYFVNSLPS
jgi:hypothetical protein